MILSIKIHRDSHICFDYLYLPAPNIKAIPAMDQVNWLERLLPPSLLKIHAKKMHEQRAKYLLDPQGEYRGEFWIPQPSERCPKCEVVLSKGLKRPFQLLDHCRTREHCRFFVYKERFERIRKHVATVGVLITNRLLKGKHITRREQHLMDFLHPRVDLPNSELSILL